MNLCYVIKDLMIMAHPYMPQYTAKVLSFFGKKPYNSLVGKPAEEGCLNWNDLGKLEGLTTVNGNEIYFKPLDDKTTEAYRQRYAGSQAERTDDKKAKKQKTKPQEKAPVDPVETFNTKIALKTAKIMKVEKHPEADKLYIETLDDGSGSERVILSGLVPYLKEEDLLGKTVVIADNLKPRKMRGIESRGMLLAADYKDAEGKDCVEVLDCSWAKPGTPVVLKDTDVNAQKEAEIDADTFFSVPIRVVNKVVCINNIPLIVDGKEITTVLTENGEVG